MANVLVEQTSLQAIADAIRAKNGTQNTYKPSQMADAIEAISGGGIVPSGTISITQNGTHDVTNYASASVNVPTGGSTPVINSLSVTENGTYTAPSGVDGYSPITVNVPQGTTPTGTKQISITANGTTTEDVTNYASAEITVNVSGGDITVASLADGTKPSGAITISGTTIKPYAFYGKTALTGVTATNYPGHASDGHQFQSCTHLTALSFPAMETGCASMFQGCSAITGIDDTMFPVLADAYADIFNGCTYVTSIVLSNFTGALNKTSKFRGMSRLQTVDLPKYQNVAGYDFYQDGALTTVKLGKTSTATTKTIQANGLANINALNVLVLYGDVVWTLANINAFANTPFASGKAGGTLYVPNDMIASYQSATNWSTILGYSTNSIQAIEGSIYE